MTVEECQIADKDFGRILKETLSFFGETGISFYHKMQHRGYLRHLLVRKAAKTGEILVDLVTTTQTELLEGQILDRWKERLLSLKLDGALTGILHTYNDSLADVVQNDRTDVLYGRDYFYEELLGLRFRITPFSFFQTNSLGAEVLYETARSYIGDTKEQVMEILNSGFADDINIHIGSENDREEFKDLSIITFKHMIGNKNFGTIGIIGPKRMDYSKVISVMKYINKKLNEELNDNDTEN